MKPTPNKRFYFYVRAVSPESQPSALPNGYRWEIWRPRLIQIVPPGIPVVPFAAWWILHFLRVFRTPSYGMLLIYHGHELVHRSVLFPKYFRFPFMGDRDLQIGDIWTSKSHRSKGLAKFALNQILRSDANCGPMYWYITDADNAASIHIAKKAGFLKAGIGSRKARFRVGLLGFFVIDQQV